MCLGNLGYKNMLPYLLHKLSLLLLLKLVKKYFGWRDYWRNLVVPKRDMCFIVKVKGLYILVRILHFMVNLNILMWDTIGFKTCWILSCLNLRKFIQMIMVLTWWLKLCQDRNLKIIAWSSGCRSPPHSRERENCWVMDIFPSYGG